MELKLTRRGDYTVRSMIHVGRYEFRSKARHIASEMQIPKKYLSQILANLVNKELLNARAGPDGGYSLALPPEEITLLDIVEAAEGPATFDHCVLRDGPCDWEQNCPVHDTWTKAQNALAQELAATTLADLVAIDATLEAGTCTPQNPPHLQPTERHGNRTQAR